MNAKVEKAFDDVIDIAASGMSGEIISNNWKVDEITKVVEPLNDEEKRELFTFVEAAAESDEGWCYSDVEFFKKLCGLE